MAACSLVVVDDLLVQDTMEVTPVGTKTVKDISGLLADCATHKFPASYSMNIGTAALTLSMKLCNNDFLQVVVIVVLLGQKLRHASAQKSGKLSNLCLKAFSGSSSHPAYLSQLIF